MSKGPGAGKNLGTSQAATGELDRGLPRHQTHRPRRRSPGHPTANESRMNLREPSSTPTAGGGGPDHMLSTGGPEVGMIHLCLGKSLHKPGSKQSSWVDVLDYAVQKH